VYAFYFTNFDDAQSLLNGLIEKNQNFSNVLKQIKKKEGKESLTSLIIQPIQRIPRYQLILHELLKYTPEFHFDYSDIKKSELLMIEVNQLLDKHSKGREMNLLIENVKEKFEHFDQNIIQPHRQLIRFEKQVYFRELGSNVNSTNETVIRRKKNEKMSFLEMLQTDDFEEEDHFYELYLFSDILLLYSIHHEEIRMFHSVFWETDITSNNEIIFEFLFKKYLIQLDDSESSTNILNDMNLLKEKEMKKLISGLDKNVKVNEILIGKKNIIKELKVKVPNFERLYDFYEKGKEELLNIEEEIFNYYKYQLKGKNSIEQNEEEKLKLTLKLEECEKKLNVDSTIIYRLNSKRREIDYLLNHFLRNDIHSFQRYFGKKIDFDESKGKGFLFIHN
jgi:hypothetical protein